MKEAIKKECKKCGKLYNLNKRYSSFQAARSKFCSRGCQYVGKRPTGGHNKGKKHPIKRPEDLVTPLQLQIRKSFENRQWRSDIFTRDNWTCVLCGQIGFKLVADHYPMSFRDIFYKYRIKCLQEAVGCAKFWDINNGRTLCKPCHLKTDNYGSKAKTKIYG